jgi:TRAP-type C4-dicarboxylate transport system permease large subunit
MVIVAAELGMVTPPVGMNAFVVARYSGIRSEEVFIGLWPHVIAHILILAAFVVWPQLILWLPTSMMK